MFLLVKNLKKEFFRIKKTSDTLSGVEVFYSTVIIDIEEAFFDLHDYISLTP